MNILTQNNTQSMTSQQIAELVGSRHDKVKQSIERLATDNEKRRAIITLPPLGETSFRDFIGKTQRTTAYIFTGEQGKRDSIIVVAQLSPEFTAALVDRWQELEQQAAAPVMQIPQTFAEALQLAANQALQIEQDAPKVAHYDAVADRKTLLNATQVAQSVHLKSPQSLNARLDKVGVYNQSIKRGRVFNSWFIEKGLGEMKQVNTGHMQPLFTTKGQIWVFELLNREVV